VPHTHTLLENHTTDVHGAGALFALHRVCGLSILIDVTCHHSR